MDSMGPAGLTRADLLRNLYAYVNETGVFPGPTNPISGSAPTIQTVQAFQLAVWNAAYDGDTNVSAGTGGTFYVTGGDVAGSVDLANAWLVGAAAWADDPEDVRALMHASVQDQALLFTSGLPPVPVPAAAWGGMGLLLAGGFARFVRRAARRRMTRS